MSRLFQIVLLKRYYGCCLWACVLVWWVSQTAILSQGGCCFNSTQPSDLHSALGYWMGYNVPKHSLRLSSERGRRVQPFEHLSELGWLEIFRGIQVPFPVCGLVMAVPFSVSSCPHFRGQRFQGLIGSSHLFPWDIKSTRHSSSSTFKRSALSCNNVYQMSREQSNISYIHLLFRAIRGQFT